MKFHCTSFLYIMLIFAHVLQAHNQSPSQPGLIILLNGTSSAGKTTLMKALHDIYDTFHVASIDTYSRNHTHGLWGKVYYDFYKDIKKQAKLGTNILVDTVLYHEKYSAYDTILTGSVKLIKILVYCPLDRLIDNVQQRNQNLDQFEHRTLHTAFTAFLSLYTIQQNQDSILIDTLTSSDVKAHLERALALIAHWPNKQIKRQHKINNKITRKFHLKRMHTIPLTTQHDWDLIVNTSLATPESLARNIADFIQTQTQH